MVKGEKQKERVFSKKVGFGLFKLIGFNPETTEDIKALGFYVKDDARDPEYIDASVDGNQRMRLDFYMEEVNTGYKHKETFFMENTPSLSKENETNGVKEPRKKEFINITGQTSWVFNDLQLSEKFSAMDYHQALKGESILIDFIKKLLNLEWQAEITYNFKKFFNGSFKELADDLAIAETIIIPLTIKHKENPENPDEIQEFQSSFKAYANGKDYKFVNLKGDKGYTDEDVEALRKKDAQNKELFADRKEGRRLDVKAKWINDIDKVVLKMKDPEWGCKNVYYLGKIRDYDGNSLPSTGKVIVEESTDY
jgi:hypothetical protein